jgi:DNA modification methylase
MNDWLRLIQGDALTVLQTLPTESVHCVVTSPPYWGLRDYGTPGQLGLEATPEEYVVKMVAVFREVKRVLRKDGTLWLNMGDSYASSPPGNTTEGVSAASTLHGVNGATGRYRETLSQSVQTKRNTVVGGLKPKDLVGIPWRLAFALQADGWYLRCDIIWSKPNPMPESVTDRPTKAHEYVFLLSKSARYYYDAEAIREPATYAGPNGHQLSPYGQGFSRRSPEEEALRQDKQRGHGRRHAGFSDRWDAMSKTEQGALGRNKRSVWEIATQPYPEAHFATFPEALVKPCILAGTSEKGCCPECGAPWERQLERQHYGSLGPRERGLDEAEVGMSRNNLGGQKVWNSYKGPTTTGWQPTCKHGHEPTGCTVLDPFVGSGTTCLVANTLGRKAIGIELNPGYLALARKRCQQTVIDQFLTPAPDSPAEAVTSQ